MLLWVDFSLSSAQYHAKPQRLGLVEREGAALSHSGPGRVSWWRSHCYTFSVTFTVQSFFYFSLNSSCSPKTSIIQSGFLPNSLLPGRCDVFHVVSAAGCAETNWGLLASRMVPDGPPLWGNGGKNSLLLCCKLQVPRQLQQLAEPSWWIIHAQVVTVSLLCGIKETSGPEAHGWSRMYF